MTSNIKTIRARLTSRLAELEMLEAAGEDERATVTLDQQAIGRLARMDLMQRQEMAKETHRRRQVERFKITATLKRIEDGEFGWCLECGNAIADRRLEIDPTAPLCVSCAR